MTGNTKNNFLLPRKILRIHAFSEAQEIQVDKGC